MGRTLPNMFALIPVNIALSFLTDRSPVSFKSSNNATAIAILTFTTVVLRGEILLLLGPVALHSLFFKYLTLRKIIAVGVISGLASLALTMFVDSYFWGKPYLWPEFSGIYFNVYEGKSVEWGTSPVYAYWTLHLPKLLLSSLPLSIIGFYQDLRIRRLLYPFIMFVGLLSLLGHKEWRFIVYVVPVFNIAAALGLRHLTSLFTRSNLFLLCIFIFSFGTNILLTYILTLTSINNYPGGTALTLFHQLYPVSEY
ncbi:putative dolichyl-P-Man:Man(7)GlcNAc(2)-PP-dolichyl-alpha-1, 6-mannosyltransferase, partial [Termitomyces sp. T112]